ncbi:uncharacterized protein LOC106669806 isoform X2 [Cimex lectularius]|uniref:LisH domain-containing protein n=1 Tax=Cimex lectularius TaxID=79782 RepID=A0A8I6TJ10_CIMLE|nr:uncharacterized protein LOC106669806 isoform X2 [Cimex lectularius]
MATEQELYEAVKRNLNKEGLTGKIKSEIRYEVLRLLGISGLKKDKNKPGLPHELGLINSLLKEYLNWVGYNFTSMMLSADAARIKAWICKVEHDHKDGHISDISRNAYAKFILVMLMEKKICPPYNDFPGEEHLCDFFSSVKVDKYYHPLSSSGASSEENEETLKKELSYIVQTSLIYPEESKQCTTNTSEEYSQNLECTDEIVTDEDYQTSHEASENQTFSDYSGFESFPDYEDFIKPLQNMDEEDYSLLARPLPSSAESMECEIDSDYKNEKPKRDCRKTRAIVRKNDEQTVNETDTLGMINTVICSINNCTILEEFVKTVSKYTSDGGVKLNQAATLETSNFRKSIKSFFDEKYKIIVEGMTDTQKEIEADYKKMIKELYQKCKEVLSEIKTVFPNFNIEMAKNNPNYIKTLMQQEFGEDVKVDKKGGPTNKESYSEGFCEDTLRKELHLAQLNLIWKQKQKKHNEVLLGQRKCQLSNLQKQLKNLTENECFYDQINNSREINLQSDIEALKRKFDENQTIIACLRDEMRYACKRHEKSMMKVDLCELKPCKKMNVPPKPTTQKKNLHK